MVVREPINLREWKAPPGRQSPGRLFTCGRPGRATYLRAKVAVAEDVIDLWERGLPQADVLHIVSLLGQKTTGLSEFSYYPFRSAKEEGAKPVFEEWLNTRYNMRRFIVSEFPTVDGRGIPRDLLDAVKLQVSQCLEEGSTIVVIDSAGAERAARVCEAIGYVRSS
jgi:hypothetical protein